MSSSGKIITSALILDGTIVDADIHAAAGIAGSKLAANSVTSTQILDGTLVDADIHAAAAIAGSKLAANSVTSTQIFDGTLVDADISAAAGIAGSKLAANAITQTFTVEATSVTSLSALSTWTDMASMTSPSMTFTGGPVLALFTGNLIHSVVGTPVLVALALDGTRGTALEFAVNAAARRHPAVVAQLLTVPAGSHVIKVQWFTTAATADMHSRGLVLVELKR